jgi:hypothetical protein
MFLEKPSMGSTKERRFSMKTSCVVDDEDGFQEKQRVDRMLEATFSMEVVVDPKRASMVRTRRSVWPLILALRPLPESRP